MRGIVSALSLQPAPENSDTGMLAAGTWTRWIGLYDMGGMGGTVATWSIADAADKDAGIGGMGVTQTAWSPCGRYLFIVERKSRGVLVYDVRATGKLVCWLEGRRAETNQRLEVDVFGAEEGAELWAGGTDGIVKVWEGVGMTEGAQERSWEWRAHDGKLLGEVCPEIPANLNVSKILLHRPLCIALALWWQPARGKDLFQLLAKGKVILRSMINNPNPRAVLQVTLLQSRNELPIIASEFGVYDNHMLLIKYVKSSAMILS